MKSHQIRIVSLLIGIPLSLCLWAPMALGQAKSAGEPAAAAVASASSGAAAEASVAPAPSEQPAQAGEKAPPVAVVRPPDPDADKVPLNLRGASIDQIVKFISDLTGKPVMKHKDAKAQITLMNDKRVSKQEAIRMICEALRLDGTSVVERNNIILLVPEGIVPQLDVAMTVPGGMVPQLGLVSRPIAVKFADMGEVEKIIRPLLSKNAGLIVHPGTRQLIITDTIERIENVEKVLVQLDALDVDNRKVQIYPLLHADSEELAPVLRAILATPAKGSSSSSRGSAQPASMGGPGGPGMPGGSGAPEMGGGAGARSASGNDVEIQSYKAANWLIVIAPEGKLAKVNQLVSEFDQELTQEVRLRVLAVKYASADDLARQLGTLVQKRYGKKVREVIEVAADQRSNSLVILSSEQNYAALQSILKELDTEESVQTKTEWFQLQYADAEDLAKDMNDLYQGMQQQNSYYDPWRYGSSSKKDVATRFVCEKRSNSLIAIAPPNEFEHIRETVRKLDQRIDDEQVAPRLFAIKHSDAKELADVLNRIFGVQDSSRQGGYYDFWYGNRNQATAKVGRLYGKARFDPLIASNAIIVTTSNKENFPIVQAFIQQMDEALPESANLLVLTLKNAQAADLARQLNGLFGREGTRLPGRAGQNQQNAQDSSQQDNSNDEEYSFLFGPQQKKDERPISDLIGKVRVVPDVRTNSLMITTPSQNHDAIRELVGRLDRPSPKVHVMVRLIEVSRTHAKNIGVRYSSDPSIFTSEDFDNGVKANLGFRWLDVHKDGVVNADVNVAALVQFVLRNFDSRVLEDTTLTMDNNRKGRIFVGSRIPFIKDSSIVNGQQNQSFEYIDAGTDLILTPIVNADNRVVMDIEMTDSRAEPGVIILGGQVLDTRTFKTMLAVENNQTVVMGGILREHNIENVRKTPILGDIPLVKWFFSKKDTSRKVTELIAFITPSVLRLPSDDAAVTRKAEKGIRGHADLPVLQQGIDSAAAAEALEEGSKEK